MSDPRERTRRDAPWDVPSWSDPVATWQHDAGIKIPAGVDVELMFTEARLLLERVAAGTGPDRLDRAASALVAGAIKAAGDTTRPVAARLAAPERADRLLAPGALVLRGRAAALGGRRAARVARGR